MPVSGKLEAPAGSTAQSSGPTFSRTTKWTQPHERRKARMGGVEEEELNEELDVELKGREKKLPNRRASSLDLELPRDVKSARDDLFAFPWERKTTSTLKLYHTFLKSLADYSPEESPFHSFHVMMNWSRCSGGEMISGWHRPELKNCLGRRGWSPVFDRRLHYTGPQESREESSSTPGEAFQTPGVLYLQPADIVHIYNI